jgi:hypothetical protein
MKPYGHSRTDSRTCKYGCCATKSSKFRSARKVVDRSNKKTARQEAKKSLSDE